MTLYLADARDVPVKDAALAVSDPPYLLSSGGKTPGKNSPKGGWLADYDNKGQPVFCSVTWAEIMDLYFQALAQQAHAYIFCNDKNLREAQNAAVKAGFRLHNVLVWNKRTAMVNGWYMKNCEYVLFLGKGRAFKIKDCGSMTCHDLFWPDETKHPTEKPWPLLQRYIENSSDAGATVLDFFMGSGSTGVAAAHCGRAFIGVEIERKWFDVAKERIEKAERAAQVLNGQRQALAGEAVQLSMGGLDI